MEHLILDNARKYSILPSLLSADVTALGHEVEAIIKAKADMLHLDVMDNHYVPNLTFGPMFCEALHKKFPMLPIDVHLMVTPVDEAIHAYASAGASRICIHDNATYHLDRSLQLIKELGVKAGLAINPATSIDVLKYTRHRLDYALIMTVNPGFGGQKMIPEVIKKIQSIHSAYQDLPLCIDGGVTIDNISLLANMGATEFVAGSAIFHSKNYSKTIAAMREQLCKA